jgi:hypothetical protein
LRSTDAIIPSACSSSSTSKIVRAIVAAKF